jgi:hypothetical protein
MPVIARAAEAVDDIEGLDGFRGSESARRMLLENGFVVTDETYRQICSFYIFRGPPFVTTDALLYAYYLNVEKALALLETAHAKWLRPMLGEARNELAAALKGEVAKLTLEKGLDPAWTEAGKEVDRYLQVAEALAAGRTGEDDLAKLPEKVAAEIRLIMAAEGQTDSPLRGVPLDYGRFRPRGLYLSSEALSDFCRAVTWLREVPFRFDNEAESRQAVFLASLWDACGSFERLSEPYEQFLGPSDDPGLNILPRMSPFFGQFVERKDCWAKMWAAMKAAPAPRHTTILMREAVRDPSLFKGVRVLPRPALYDNDVLKPLFPFGLERSPVSGEELMAALGSQAAEEIVLSREGKVIPEYGRLLQEARVAAAEAEKKYSSPLQVAQRALWRTLLAQPSDPALPAWYRHPAWRYKDLNTALSGWAHYRYVWDLHGKRHASYSCLVMGLEGVVEPNPRFLEALLELAVRTDVFFRAHEVNLPKFADLELLLLELRGILKAQLAGQSLSETQKKFLEDFGPSLAGVCGFEGNSWVHDENLPDTPFCVPVAVDVAGRRERVVGQARPRAIYVIVERGGRRYLTVGGVLSYRDHVGPAEGPGHMTSPRWAEAAASRAAPAMEWQAKFSAGFSQKELLADLRAGRIRPQMFEMPTREMGDVLADMLEIGRASCRERV